MVRATAARGAVHIPGRIDYECPGRRSAVVRAINATEGVDRLLFPLTFFARSHFVNHSPGATHQSCAINVSGSVEHRSTDRAEDIVVTNVTGEGVEHTKIPSTIAIR